MLSETAHINDFTLHYLVEGHGPDVLMVHGWGSSRRMWAHLSSELSSARRCWSVDLPGFGDSDKPTNGWHSIPNYTATLHHFMEAMGLQRAHVIGHSMGGLIALDFAATHPERVTRLVAINPVVTGRATWGRMADWGRSAAVLDRTQRLSRRLIHPVLAHPLGDSLHHGVKYLRRRFEDFSRTTAETLMSSGRAIVTYDVLPKLPRITAPTLIVLGSLDANVPNSEGHLAAVEIPNARLVVFTAGHSLTDDRPAEAVRLLREFLM
jgi:pimeloyl-ACP methyl ester carboxylesterase